MLEEKKEEIVLKINSGLTVQCTLNSQRFFNKNFNNIYLQVQYLARYLFVTQK